MTQGLRARTIRVTVATIVSVSAVCACAPHQGGPLEGPRATPGDIAICVPGGESGDAYFGEVLVNTGDAPVEIATVVGSAFEHAEVAYFVDVEGYDLGEMVGGFHWPVDGADAIGFEAAVIERLQDPAEVVIAPGSEVVLYTLVTAAGPADDAVVTESTVTYTSGGREYKEVISLEYRVPRDGVCDPAAG